MVSEPLPNRPLTHSLRRGLTLLALLALAQWFFGNLYEAVVISPNWVVDSPRQLTRLNEFVVRTHPAVYFVPASVIGPILVWGLTGLNRDPALTPSYRRASFFAALAMLLNAYIVATIVRKLFGPGYLAHPDDLGTSCRRWNILNVARMTLVAAASVCLFGAFRKLDRKS